MNIHEYCITNTGLQILDYKYWIANTGLQILDYKYWIPNTELQILYYKYCIINTVLLDNWITGLLMLILILNIMMEMHEYARILYYWIPVLQLLDYKYWITNTGLQILNYWITG